MNGARSLSRAGERDGGRRAAFKYIVPGDPDNSWLYKKITGATSDCTTAGCITGPMPPDTQPDVTAADAATIRQWILMGAPGPSSP